MLAVLAGLVAWSWVAIDGASSGMLYRGGLLAHSLACAVVISLVVAADRGWFVRGLGWRPLAWIGVLSYGLYLWHWPIYVVLSPQRTGIDGVPLLGVRMAVSLAFAYASYRLVEDPVRHRATWARGRSGVAVLVAVVVGVILLLVALPDPTGQIAEFDPSAIAAGAPVVRNRTGRDAGRRAGDDSSNAASPPRTAAPIGDGAAAAAVAPAEGAAPTVAPTTVPPTTVPLPRQEIHSVMWAGDSVSYDLAPAVIASLTAAGLDVDTHASYYGFRLIADADHYDLSQLIPKEVAKVRPDVVLMQISLWDTPVDDDTYGAALVKLAVDLDVLGTSLVVVGAPPTAMDDMNEGMTRLFGVASDLAAVSATDNFDVLDPAPMWGPVFVRDFDGDGVPERKQDSIHVCGSGAAHFAAWLAPALAERYDGVEPGDPFSWASGSWGLDPRYDDPVGTCARL